MSALADVLRRLRSLVFRRRLEDGLDDEIRFHVEQQTEKNQRAGMTPDEARRQALIRFGGVQQVRERTQDEFGHGVNMPLAACGSDSPGCPRSTGVVLCGRQPFTARAKCLAQDDRLLLLHRVSAS